MRSRGLIVVLSVLCIGIAVGAAAFFFSTHRPGRSGVTANFAPTVPTGLFAQPLSSSRIKLSWTASRDDKKVIGYVIYRDGKMAGSSETNSYTDTGLAPGTSHTYSVVAYDDQKAPSMPPWS